MSCTHVQKNAFLHILTIREETLCCHSVKKMFYFCDCALRRECQIWEPEEKKNSFRLQCTFDNTMIIMFIYRILVFTCPFWLVEVAGKKNEQPIYQFLLDWTDDSVFGHHYLACSVSADKDINEQKLIYSQWNNVTSMKPIHLHLQQSNNVQVFWHACLTCRTSQSSWASWIY